ncbi:transposable element Tcb1 transposase [Trichonephila clavipes]|nr:transposable element Tcb1 transposase [Trichonephila clavipes]
MRICDRWMQEGTADRRGRSHPPQFTTSLSARTIRRRLQHSGLSARSPLLGLPLTQNRRRLHRQWCEERRMWAAEWNEVVFTDESRICQQRHDGRIQVWRHCGERMLNSCVMHRHTGPAPDIMDNARPHVVRIVQRLFVNHQLELIFWPALSPDLSPIENMWSMVTQRLTQTTPPAATPDPLWQRMEAAWSAVSQEHIQSLFESMPRRVAALNGYVNKQNCRIWSEANPQVYVETPLHPEKLTVWCVLWAGRIIGPYVFKNDEGHNVTVNGDRYRAMITNFFIPELNNHDVQEMWFQQDGATCHTARATIDLLKDTFGDRLISRFGPVNWPPRSCDLTPLDYFLRGHWSMRISHKRLTIGKTTFAVLLPIYGHKCWKKSSKIGRPDWTTSEPAVAVICQKSYLKCNAT